MYLPNEETDSPRDYKRKVRYMELKGYKYVKCGCYNGSGYYDTCIRGKIPKCSYCQGKGVCWEKQYK